MAEEKMVKVAAGENAPLLAEQPDRQDVVVEIQAQETERSKSVVEADRARALAKLVEFQKSLDTYLRSLLPEDDLQWVQTKDGSRKPVLTRSQYARIYRGLALTEPDPPQFQVREVGGVTVFECMTRVVWPMMGLQAFGVGCAGTDEVAPNAPLGRKIHDAKAKAHTRAWERAIANLIGLGALGEEEVEGHPELEQVSPALRYVLERADSLGISREELAAYVRIRWGEKLENLHVSKVVMLKKILDQIKTREEWTAEVARWSPGGYSGSPLQRQ